MKMKKILSALLATVFALSLVTVPSFAETSSVTTAEALTTALAAGGEVTLGGDISGVTQITIPQGVTTVLDLNGNDIDAAFDGDSTTNHVYVIDNKGTLTIKDSSTEADGAIRSRGIWNYGTLTLESGTIDAIDGNGGYAVNNEAGSTFTMNGGTVIASYEDDYADEDGGYDATPVDVPSECTATLNGGSFSGSSGGDVWGTTGTVINGGTFENLTETQHVAVGAVITNNGETVVKNADGTTSAVEEGTVALVNGVGYKTLAEAKAAAQTGDTIYILAGTYNEELSLSGVSVVGIGDVKIIGKLSVSGDNITVKNIDVEGTSTNIDVGSLVINGNGTIEDCNIKGYNGMRYCYANNGDVTIKNCVITGDVYGVHFDAGNGDGDVIIDGCTITGWTSFGGAVENVSISNTKFENGNYDKLRFYQNSTVTGVTFNPEMSVDFGKDEVTADFTNCSVSDGSPLTDVIYLGDIANMGVVVTVDNEKVAVEASVAHTEGDETNTTYYTTFEEAVAAAVDGDVVTLLTDIADGTGIVIDKSITVDFGGKTYTIVGPAVGSTGTETLGFQLLAGDDTANPNDIVLKNGTINVSENNDKVLGLVWNYSDLTLEDITLDGRNSTGLNATLSNNNGTSVLQGKTNLYGENAIYSTIDIDGSDWAEGTYPSVSVTIDTTGTIDGKTEVYGSLATAVVKNGTFTGDFTSDDKANTTIYGGTFANDVTAWCAEGYEAVANEDGTFGVVEKADPAGTLYTGVVFDDSAAENDSYIYFDIKDMIATESIEIKLYSGSKLLSTTVLSETGKENGYLAYISLSAKVEITDDSSSWDTTWEVAPNAAYVPDKAVLYIDGVKMNSVGVNMYNTDYPANAREWKDIEGVTIPEVPTATITELIPGVGNVPSKLDFAMQFAVVKPTEDQVEYYGDWYADFELKLNKDAIFHNTDATANGYLSGEYGDWSWIDVPFTHNGNTNLVELKAGETLKIMETAAKLLGESGLQVTYNDVLGVNIFNCGIDFTDEYLAGNEDLEVTLTLNMYNPDNPEEVYTIGDVYTFTPSDIKKAVAEVNGTKYTTVQEAVNAANAGDTVKILENVTLTDSITITDGKDVTITGEGKTITGAEGKDVFVVKGGKLTLAEGLNVHAPTDCCIYITNGDVYTAANLTKAGTSYSVIQGNGNTSGNVTITGGTVKNEITDKCAIYWPQDGKLTITGGTITGGTAVRLSSGSLEITGGTLTANGTKTDYVASNGGSVPDTGDAVMIENIGGDTGYEAITSVVISGGTFTSANAKAVASYTAGNEGVAAVTGFVYGGTFSSAVDATYCADGYEPVANDDGTYGVQVKAEVEKKAEIKFGLYNGTYKREINGEEVDCYRVKILSAIDTLDYEEVGINYVLQAVNAENKAVQEEYSASTKTVYTSVTDKKNNKVYTSEDMGIDNGFVYGVDHYIPVAWYNYNTTLFAKKYIVEKPGDEPKEVTEWYHIDLSTIEETE